MLKSKGIKVPRPNYDGKATDSAVEQDGETPEDSEEDEEDTKPVNKSKSKLDKFKLKPNHEATSDEDDD